MDESDWARIAAEIAARGSGILLPGDGVEITFVRGELKRLIRFALDDAYDAGREFERKLLKEGKP